MNNYLNTENHLHPKEKKWFAVYTNYKREKLVAKDLAMKGIEVYLPIQKIVRQWERKRRTVELPLISCYVFVKINKSEYKTVLENEYVLRFVKFSRNLISIPNKEIELIKRILGESVGMSLEKANIRTGEKVEIVWKSLTGIRGVLQEIRGKNEVVVELEQLGYCMRILVPSEGIIKAMPIH